MTALLGAVGLAKRYPTRDGALHAVDGVDLHIRHGESVGLVEESGCGKPTLVRLLARLIAPTEGAIVFDGQDIAAVPLGRFVRSPQRSRIQSVFQDPTESLTRRSRRSARLPTRSAALAPRAAITTWRSRCTRRWRWSACPGR